MAGIAFRNPNAFEQFYDDQGVSQNPNPWLGHEQIQSLEAAVERKIDKRLNAVATIYHYRLRGLIEAFSLRMICCNTRTSRIMAPERVRVERSSVEGIGDDRQRGDRGNGEARVVRTTAGEFSSRAAQSARRNSAGPGPFFGQRAPSSI